MKRYLMSLLLMAVMAVITACSLDSLPEEKVEEKTEVGYLQFSKFAVVADTENKDSNDEIETGGTTPESGTRTRADETITTQHNFSNYFIEIIRPGNSNTADEVVWSGKYSENLNIPLEPGRYNVWAYQDNNKMPAQDVAVDKPYYAGMAVADIRSGETTPVSVICRLHNIRVTVELSADLKDMFKEYDNNNSKRLKTDVTMGKGSDTTAPYTFERSATHSSPLVYFRDMANGPDNTMSILLTGEFYTGPVEDIYTNAAFSAENSSKWKEVKMEKKVVGTSSNPVTGGQWRKISVDIEHNDEGNAQFVFTVDSYVYDEEITVSTQTYYSEMITLKQEDAIPEDDINDEMAPQVRVEGVTADEDGVFNYSITADMIDTDVSTGGVNDWNTNLKVNIAVPAGSSATIKSVYAEFKESTSASLLEALDSSEFENRIIPLFPVSGVDRYLSVATDGSKFSLNDAGMDAIYNYEGTHRIRIHTEGSDGRVGFADVVVTVSQTGGAGPKVVWMVDGAASNALTMSFGDKHNVIAEIKSTTGLTGLNVAIDSSSIPEQDLIDLGLATEMDILNPATEKMKEKLTDFGFLPLNDSEMKNIKFEITNFMETLAGLGSGVHNFTIKATDISGSSTKTLSITVVE